MFVPVKLPLVLILVFLLIPAVHAPQKTTFTNDRGLTVEYPEITVYKQNTTNKFHFHVFNNSNGVYLTNSTVTCYYHLYDNAGNHIIKTPTPMAFDSSTNYDFEVTLNNNNFTRAGEYAIITQCNTSTDAGFIAFNFQVTPTGDLLDIPKTIIYIVGLFSLSAIFIIFLMLFIKIPFKNNIKQGHIEFIKQYRIFKIGAFCLMYLTFIFILALLIQLTYYINNPGLNNTFIALYKMLLIFIYPVLIVSIIASLIIFVHDYVYNKNIKKIFERSEPFGDD